MAIKLKTLTVLRRKMPDRAYLPNAEGREFSHGTPTVLGLRFGQTGCFPVFTSRTADQLNAEEGVTPQQLAAMSAGSNHGWDHPTADPDHPDYTEKNHES